MKYRFFAMLLVMVMLCACLTGATADEKEQIFEFQNYKYTLPEDGTAEIVGYTSSAGKVLIPDTLDGKTVTRIRDNPFSGCHNLKKISVSPENGFFATIDDVLFRKSDKTLIAYPPAKLAETYTIPQGVQRIGEGAFKSCTSLTDVTIPDSVVEIENNPFYGCTSLIQITVSPKNTIFSVNNGVLFDKSTKTLLVYPEAKSGKSYAIPQGTQKIADSAFYCATLENVTVPNSVVQIGAWAFAYCKALTSIAIPNSVTQIGEHAFTACKQLKLVTIPNSVTQIGEYAFIGCSAISSITLPDNITQIEEGTFYACSDLTSIIIPNSVVQIKKEAFYKCASLTDAVILNAVTEIDTSAFDGCTYLTLTVPHDSYALEYAKNNNISYTYSAANDWLNN